jgi:hypothetical protein
MKGNSYVVSQQYEKHYLVGHDTMQSDKNLWYFWGTYCLHPRDRRNIGRFVSDYNSDTPQIRPKNLDIAQKNTAVFKSKYNTLLFVAGKEVMFLVTDTLY